ncbi:MAG: DUF4369 domain-containing protein, partial [Flavisolibacter sp.]
MKKILILLAFIPTLLIAQNKGFTIHGTIKGLPDGEAKITTTQENVLVASGQIKNEQFLINGSIPEPSIYYLVLPNEKPQYLFLE